MATKAKELKSLPNVSIVIITYKRPEELQKTLDALKKNLEYPADKLTWIIADDHSGDDYQEMMSKYTRFHSLNLQWIVTSQNSGWGANANNVLRQVKDDYVFFIEDDYVLKYPIDLRVGVAMLEKMPHVGMLRYRGTAGMHVVNHQFEVDISDYVAGHHDGEGVEGKVTYMLLDSGSPDLWLYSNGPHLKHRRFHDFYGVYPEGIPLGETEERYAHQVKDGMKRQGAFAIAIQPEFVTMRFQHIGKSYQGTEADIQPAPEEPAKTE